MSILDRGARAHELAVRESLMRNLRNIWIRLLRFLRKDSAVSTYIVYAVIVFAICMTLSLFRLSTASLPFSSDGTDDARILINSVRMTRSDDFLRGIPRWISFQQGGTPDSVLDYSNSVAFRNASSTPVLESFERFVLLPDDIFQKALSRIAPLEVKFAMREWFVYLRVFLVIPLFFKILGLRLRSGVLAAVAVSMTPLSVWLGGSAAAMTAAAFLPLVCAGLFLKVFYSTIRCRRVFLFATGTYALTSSVTAVDYPPWKWPMLLIFGSLVFMSLLNDYGIRRLVWPLALLLIPVGLYQGIRWVVYRDQFAVVLNTVYPGKRRAGGGGGYGNVMAGAITWLMQTKKSRASATINPEFAFGLNSLIWPVVIYCPLLLVKCSEDKRRKAILASLLPTFIIILWVTAKWPTSLLKFNPLVFVTTDRAGQILGLVAVLLALMVAEVRPELPLGTRVGLGVFATILVIQQSLPDSLYWLGYFYKQYPTNIAWISVVVLAFCVFLFVIIRRPFLASVPIVLFLICSSVGIQPITVGLGPLVSSPLASEIRELKEVEPSALWGSDPFWGDALVIAQGVTMLSGQQPLGPNVKRWSRLDPKREFTDIWNRGQSYVHFIWDRNEPSIRMSNPSPDVISVVISPCNSVLRRWKLRYLMTEQAPGPCMKRLFESMWMGKNVSIFEINS